MTVTIAIMFASSSAAIGSSGGSISAAASTSVPLRSKNTHTARMVPREAGSTSDMPTDPTLAQLVRRAVAIVDPPGTDPAVEEFALRFEDADEPVRGELEQLEERLRWGADEDPPIMMAQAVTLYLAHRVDELDDEPEDVLRLAARAEFDGDPPEPVTRWLEDQGVRLS
jgi:hypothetical protein